MVVPLCGVITVPRSSARRARRAIHKGRATARERAASASARVDKEGGRASWRGRREEGEEEEEEVEEDEEEEGEGRGQGSRESSWGCYAVRAQRGIILFLGPSLGETEGEQRSGRVWVRRRWRRRRRFVGEEEGPKEEEEGIR